MAWSIQPTVQWRDVLGRFAKPPVDDAIGAGLLALGQQTVDKLRPATPVRTGRARAGWLATYYPSQKRVQISNEAPYGMYLITGTRYMAPNPNLQAVMRGIPGDARITLRGIGQDLIARLKGD